MSEVIVRLISDHIKVKGGEYVQDVVRCKDCKWFRKSPNTEHDYDDSCGVWANICNDDDFCSYGEVRNE